MLTKTIRMEYRIGGVLTDADNVILGSEDGTYGVKRKDTGEVIVPYGTAVDHLSTGKYSKSVTLAENVIYVVSWQVSPTPSSLPKFYGNEIGPFTNPTETLRAVADVRGSFIQGTMATVFLRVQQFNVGPVDPESISLVISDSLANNVLTATPEKISTGFYFYDWNVPTTQTPGNYTVTWTYTVEGVNETEVQELVVVEATNFDPHTLYAGAVSEFRTQLTYMIPIAQSIPLYNEESQSNLSYRTYRFTFDKWNQTPPPRLYVNKKRVTQGAEINFFTGEVTFDSALTPYDTVVADYNFRWYTDQELDTFLSHGMSKVNATPTASNYNFINLPDIWIPAVMYGAVIDAIRNLMLRLLTMEAKLVFGGPEGARETFSQLETLKKNYEEDLKELLEKKKLQGYVGLTRMVTTPEYTLPGGRSRWFRSLFSGGSA